MNAITLLKADHQNVEELFKKFEQLGRGKAKQKRSVVDKIIKELTVHAAIEEELFYPTVREEMGGAEEDVLEFLEEHHIVKWTLSELQHMPPHAERFDAKVTVLIENVRHHVREEEKGLFPQVSKALGRKRLEEIGAGLVSAKKVAPTRPHPHAPDSPPMNIPGNITASLMDKTRDFAKEVVEKVIEQGREKASEVSDSLHETFENKRSPKTRRG